MRTGRRAIWGLAALVAVWLAVIGQQRVSQRDYVLDGVLFLAIATGLFLVAITRKSVSEEPAVWPQNVSTPRSTRAVPLVPVRVQPLLLVAVGLGSACASTSRKRA